MTILLGLFFALLVFFLLVSSYFFLPTRFTLLNSLVVRKLKLALGRSSSFWVVYVLFLFLFITNLVGNFPLSSVPTLFYSETLTLSLAF